MSRPSPPPTNLSLVPLSVEAIHQAMDDSCDSCFYCTADDTAEVDNGVNEATATDTAISGRSCCYHWRRAHAKDVPGMLQCLARSSSSPTSSSICQTNHAGSTVERDGGFSNSDFSKEVPLYYSLVLTKEAPNKETMSSSTLVDGVAILFVAYSTWEGRVLYVNRLQVPLSSSSQTEETLSLFKILAKIAVQLDCTRLVWQHTQEMLQMYKNMGAFLYEGVLTLKMDRTAMDAFLSSRQLLQKDSTSTATGTTAAQADSTTSVPAVVDEALEPINIHFLALSKLKLQRANLPQDVQDVRMLIQGLANHVKEPDAVHISLDQLKLDCGFFDEASSSSISTTSTTTALLPPLYYALLLRNVETNEACGVAVFYFGYDIDTGQYLYLEDLFIEETYRGRSAGTSIMLVLAKIAQMLDCASFVWQALDWNTPSLDFYSKMGATIQTGLLTSKFAGAKLVSLANA